METPEPRTTTVGGITFTAAEVPPDNRHFGSGRTPLAALALQAMDELGVDSVYLGVRAAGDRNKTAKRLGIPVRFATRNLRQIDGKKRCDLYAYRTDVEGE